MSQSVKINSQRIIDLELNARNVEISGNLDIQKFIQMARKKDEELAML